jgi:very-short-patch-repair endonuclease
VDAGEIATPVLRTVLDCATTMPFPQALAIADSALAERLVRPEHLADAARRSRGPGRARRMRVAACADWRAANAFESCLRGVVLEAGLTGFEPQLEVRLPRRVVHVDLGDPRRLVALEADSFAHHGSRSDLKRDCERYDELACEGWKVLRFAWEHVMFEQPWVADVVTTTCRVRGAGVFVTTRHDVAPDAGRAATSLVR